MSGSFSGRFSRKMLCTFMCIILGFSFAINLFGSYNVNADVSGSTNKAEFWNGGGQIRVGLSGTSGYTSVTVVVQFNGTIDSASGWSCDDVTVNGNQVIATIYYGGGNSWIFDNDGGEIGIGVSGSNISEAWVVSAYGSGSVDTPTPEPTATNTPTPKPTNTNTPTPTKKPTNTPTPTKKIGRASCRERV